MIVPHVDIVSKDEVEVGQEHIVQAEDVDRVFTIEVMDPFHLQEVPCKLLCHSLPDLTPLSLDAYVAGGRSLHEGSSVLAYR